MKRKNETNLPHKECKSLKTIERREMMKKKETYHRNKERLSENIITDL